MKYQHVFILMYKNFEVLSFGANYEKCKVKVLKKLEHFDKAPNRLLKAENDERLDLALLRLINHRRIPDTRTGYDEIIKATGFSSGFELSFQAHGLTLSDHYWYKKEDENLRYEDINFFTNKWDDSFARAVLNQNYEKLKHCSLNVPDVCTAGWGAKGWIYEEDGPKLYKLGINDNHSEEALGEVLASQIAIRLINDKEVLKYELRKAGNRYASVSPVMININEDLFPLSEFVDGKLYFLYRSRTVDKSRGDEFFEKIKNCEVPGLYEFFIKLACLRDLCFVSDLHFENISIIRNSETGQIRFAPIYDLGGAFGSSRTGQSLISNFSKSTLVLVYYLFSDLKPDWDYSWYNPDRLIGIEDEIRSILSKSEFYSEELIGHIIEVYRHQKEVLDKMAKGSLKNS